MVGKAWQCGHEPTGHMASAFEREDECDIQLSLLSSVWILQQDVTRLLSDSVSPVKAVYKAAGTNWWGRYLYSSVSCSWSWQSSTLGFHLFIKTDKGGMTEFVRPH